MEKVTSLEIPGNSRWELEDARFPGIPGGADLMMMMMMMMRPVFCHWGAPVTDLLACGRGPKHWLLKTKTTVGPKLPPPFYSSVSFVRLFSPIPPFPASPFYPLPSPSYFFPGRPAHLNPARGSGERCTLPAGLPNCAFWAKNALLMMMTVMLSAGPLMGILPSSTVP